MTNQERVIEALEYRIEEMVGEQESERTQIGNLTGNLLKLNYDLTENLNELSAIKGCIRKLEKSGLNENELIESRKLFESQLELVEVAIQTNRAFTEAMGSKIDGLKMVHDDLTADIEAITEFVSGAKKEPIQPLVAVNESA